MSRSDLLGAVINVVNSAGVDYMIVGSFAASAHGFERTTHDIDMVIILPQETVPALASAFGEGFYFDEEAAREAVDRVDMFNIIHYDSGFKIDFWMLKDDEFSRTRFGRRVSVEVMGIPSYVESPEDTVLSKLLWYKITPSERQLSDARGVLLFQHNKLDFSYLRNWADRLGVADLLESIGS